MKKILCFFGLHNLNSIVVNAGSAYERNGIRVNAGDTDAKVEACIACDRYLRVTSIPK